MDGLQLQTTSAQQLHLKPVSSPVIDLHEAAMLGSSLQRSQLQLLEESLVAANENSSGVLATQADKRASLGSKNETTTDRSAAALMQLPSLPRDVLCRTSSFPRNKALKLHERMILQRRAEAKALEETSVLTEAAPTSTPADTNGAVLLSSEKSATDSTASMISSTKFALVAAATSPPVSQVSSSTTSPFKESARLDMPPLESTKHASEVSGVEHVVRTHSLPEAGLQVETPSPARQNLVNNPAKLQPGVIVNIGGDYFQISAALGTGSFGVVWSALRTDEVGGMVNDEAGSSIHVAIKEMVCGSQAELMNALSEGNLLGKLSGCKVADSATTGNLHSALSSCIPCMAAQDSEQLGPTEWRVRLAMSRIQGEPLVLALQRLQTQQYTEVTQSASGTLGRLAEPCRVASELLTQLGPALQELAKSTFHRDINPRNIIVDGLGNASKQSISFGLVDFGMAVDARNWLGSDLNDGAWQHVEVGGDCRYWPLSSWVMFLHGPKYLPPDSSLRREYQCGLDCHSLGITALQVLMDLFPVLPADCKGASSQLLGALRDLQKAWKNYWEDVSRFWAALYDCFANQGDWVALKNQCIQQGLQAVVCDRVSGLKHALNAASRACIASPEEDGSSQLEVLLRALDALVSDAGSPGRQLTARFSGSQDEHPSEGRQKHVQEMLREEQKVQEQLQMQQEVMQQLLQEKQQLLVKKREVRQQHQQSRGRQSLPGQQLQESDVHKQKHRQWQQLQHMEGTQQQHQQPPSHRPQAQNPHQQRRQQTIYGQQCQRQQPTQQPQQLQQQPQRFEKYVQGPGSHCEQQQHDLKDTQQLAYVDRPSLGLLPQDRIIHAENTQQLHGQECTSHFTSAQIGQQGSPSVDGFRSPVRGRRSSSVECISLPLAGRCSPSVNSRRSPQPDRPNIGSVAAGIVRFQSSPIVGDSVGIPVVVTACDNHNQSRTSPSRPARAMRTGSLPVGQSTFRQLPAQRAVEISSSGVFPGGPPRFYR